MQLNLATLLSSGSLDTAEPKEQKPSKGHPERRPGEETAGRGNSFFDFLLFLTLEDYNLYVTAATAAATLNHEVTLRIEATCYKDGAEIQKKAGSPMTVMLPDCHLQTSFKREINELLNLV